MTGPCFIRQLDSPVGPLIVAAADAGICLLEFADPARSEGHRQRLRRLFGADMVDAEHPYLSQLETELRDYFAGGLQQFTVPVAAPGTPFQERVWSQLCQIPYGKTRCYEQIAAAVGAAGAQRAVGRANGSNRVAIVIPCHRVVNKDGGLGGYAGEGWRKEALLGLERTGRLLPRAGLFVEPAAPVHRDVP